MMNFWRHRGKSTSSISTRFLRKYPFQNPKKKNAFPLHDLKTQTEVGKKSGEKSVEKAEREKDGV